MRKLLLFILSFVVMAGFSQQSKAGGGGEAVEGSKEYVKIDPLVLPIIDSDGLQQNISMVVQIEVDGVNEAEKVKRLRPRLTDAYIQDMYGSLNKYAALQGGVVRVDVIKKRLNEVTSKILGEDLHGEVLLQVVHQRPI